MLVIRGVGDWIVSEYIGNNCNSSDYMNVI